MRHFQFPARSPHRKYVPKRIRDPAASLPIEETQEAQGEHLIKTQHVQEPVDWFLLFTFGNHRVPRYKFSTTLLPLGHASPTIVQEALLRTVYAAFNARDAATALKALAPEVEWPDQFEGKTLNGPEAVGKYLHRRWTTFDPYTEVKHVAVNADGHVVLTLVQTMHGPGRVPISLGLIRHVYEFENGLVRRMRILL